MKFLNAELGRVGRGPLETNPVIDTLAMARKRFPGAPASLDALCRRFGVDNSGRVHHGALLDSELLADVYLELSGGRQPGLVFQADAVRAKGARTTPDVDMSRQPQQRRSAPLPARLSEDERIAHRAFLEDLPQNAIWFDTGADGL